MSKSNLCVAGLLVGVGLVWQLRAQQEDFARPPAFDAPATSFHSVAPPTAVDFAAEPVADPHVAAKQVLNALNAKLVERMSPEQIQQAIADATNRLRNQEAEAKVERARVLLQEVVGEAPDSAAAERARRGLEATDPNRPAPVIPVLNEESSEAPIRVYGGVR